MLKYFTLQTDMPLEFYDAPVARGAPNSLSLLALPVGT